MSDLTAEVVAEVIKAHDRGKSQEGFPRPLDASEGVDFFDPRKAIVGRMLWELDRVAAAFRDELAEGGRKQQTLYLAFKAWLRSSPVDESAYQVLVTRIAERLGI